MKKSRETIALVLLLVLGLAPRLVFISIFPVIPVSDFGSQVDFAQYLHKHGLISNIWYWDHFNPGFPLILCLLFYIFPGQDPVTVARLATTLLGGLLPLLPFLVWRGVLPLWVRMLAGVSLALWPGHLLFSGAVTQDSWVIFPSAALAVLAVRSLLSREPPRPLAGGLLYAAAVAIRQEMLVVLFPLLLVAAWGGLPIRWRRTLSASLAAGLPLLALASFRYASTGRFSLRSPNSGQSILGSYVPGASAYGWIDPYAYFSSVRPDLLNDHHAFFAHCQSVALQEALRRPAFHAARILSSVFSSAVGGESASLYWTLAFPGVPTALPEPVRERGMDLYKHARVPLQWEMAVIQALFLASLIIGLQRRRMTILVLASAVLLKYGFHGITVMQGRYVFVASALEILTIALAVYEIRTMVPVKRWLVVRALAVGMVFGLGLFRYAPRLAALVNSHDIYPQRTYQFVLEPWGTDRKTALACVVDQGALVGLGWPLSSNGTWSATIRTLEENPAPGEKAVAVCELTGAGEPRTMMLQIFDPYPAGGRTGRMVQRVELDGVEVFSLDIAQAPWTGRTNIPLGNVGAGTKRKVVIEVKAIQPDPGAGWGEAARTEFRLIDSSYIPHLALGRPATQSSTLSGYGAASSRAAADGDTDGDFFNGSVTHTDREANPWWQVDLGSSVPIGSIAIWNRTDACCSDRLNDYWVFISNTPFRPTDTPATLKSRAGTWSSHQTEAPHPSTKITTAGARGRYVRVQLSGTNHLSLAEVQVFGQ